MHPPLLRSLALAGFMWSALGIAHAAQQAAAVAQNQTYEQIKSQLESVRYDLRFLEDHIKEIRKDLDSNLCKPATLRILDISEIVARSSVSLDRLPRAIGSMERDGRWESLYTRRREELFELHKEQFAKNGQQNRYLEGYGEEVLKKCGFDVKSALARIKELVEQGRSTSALKQDLVRAVNTDNTATFNAAAGSDSAGGSGAVRAPANQSPIVSVEADPNNPGHFIITYADGTRRSVPGTRNPDGTATLNVDGRTVTMPVNGGGGAMGPGDDQSGGMGPGDGRAGTGPGVGGGQFDPNRPPSGYEAITANGQTVGWRNQQTGEEVYFLQGGNSVGQTYRGGRGTNLVREEKVEMKDAGGGRYEPQKTGEVVNWRFDIDLNEEPAGTGKKMTFRLVNRSGEGDFTVSGWRIISPNNANLADGSGEEASAVINESGNYRVEFSGSTAWGSPFRITNEVGVQM